jgi:hypothetical protein
MIRRYNWGTGIALAYVAFALTTTGFVVFAMGRPVALVRADYYAESLRQDARMRAVANAQELGSAVSVVSTTRGEVMVSIPRDQSRRARGTVTFYRASDPGADRVLELTPGPDGRDELSVAGMAPGYWVVQLRWSADGRDYLVDQAMVLP